MIAQNNGQFQVQGLSTQELSDVRLDWSDFTRAIKEAGFAKGEDSERLSNYGNPCKTCVAQKLLQKDKLLDVYSPYFQAFEVVVYCPKCKTVTRRYRVAYNNFEAKVYVTNG